MEKKDRVTLIKKHWGCSDKNAYKLLASNTFQKKLKIVELGCICAEYNVSKEELIHVLKFIEGSKKINGN